MNRTFLTFAILMLSVFSVAAKPGPFTTGRLNLINNQSQLPFIGLPALFYKKPHFGAQAGIDRILSEKGKHRWNHSVTLGAYYHRFAHTAIQLYTGVDYERGAQKNFGWSVGFHAGYVHLIQDSKVFVLDDNGVYQSKFRWGRPQVMGGLNVQLRWHPVSWKGKVSEVFLGYLGSVQYRFVKVYVPIMPNSILQAGIRMNLNSFRKGEGK